MLKLLHTADLHLGLESAQFEPDARRRLARARLDVARTILSVAEQYAVDAVRSYGVLRGVVLAAWRLLRCNPWSHGGVDFVEDQKLFRPRPHVQR